MVGRMNRSGGSLGFDLHLAITRGDTSGVISLVSRLSESELNELTFANKSTPLSLAVYLKLDQLVGALLRANADPNRISCDSLGRIEPPLCSAVRIGDAKIFQCLIRSAAIDVNQTDFFGQTPLWLAVRERHIEFVRAIINHNSFSFASKWLDARDTSPLYLSFKYLSRGRTEIAKLLLNCGFKVSQECAQFAINSNNAPILEMVRRSSGLCFDQCLTDGKRSPLSLKDLSRIAIRNEFVSRTCLAIRCHTLSQYYRSLPNHLIEFLTHLQL